MASTATKKEKNLLKHTIQELPESLPIGTEINAVYNISQSDSVGSIIDMSLTDLDNTYAQKTNIIYANKNVETQFLKKMNKISDKIYESEEISFADYKTIESIN